MPIQEEPPAQGNDPSNKGPRRFTTVALWAVALSTLLVGLASFALAACRGMR